MSQALGRRVVPGEMEIPALPCLSVGAARLVLARHLRANPLDMPASGFLPDLIRYAASGATERDARDASDHPLVRRRGLYGYARRRG